MTKEKSTESKSTETKSRRKSKYERTIDAQIELENEEILKHCSSDGLNITYKRPLRKL